MSLPSFAPHSQPTFAPQRRVGKATHLPRWMYSGVFSLLILAGLFLGSGNAAGVAYADSGLPYKTANGESEKPPLQFYDGIGNGEFVQHDPKVYLVFWGPAWNSDQGTVSTIAGVFKALAGSEYNNILSQYWDNTGGYFTNKVTLMDDNSQIIDSSTPPSNIDIGFESPLGVWDNAQIRHETDHLISQYKWRVDRNTQIIVIPQKGTTYSHGGGFCGVHSYDSTASSPYAYAMVQYGDQNTGCDFVGSSAGDIVWSAVHEYTEAVTDPQIYVTATVGSPWYTALGSGWHTKDSDKSTPQEVADLCEGYYPENNGSISYYYANGLPLPYLWSNIANGCVMSQGQEYASPDYTAPFHGIHTVQGVILSHYQGPGIAGILGEPTSEETPIAGGRVSYFANSGCGAGSAIYWSYPTGAYEVHGCIMAHYKSMNEANSAVGFPVTDETNAPGGGRVNYFGGTSWGSHCTTYGGPAPYTNSYAAIYWTGSAAVEVIGCIYNYYQNVAGGPAGGMGLGLPTNKEVSQDGGSVETFAGSSCGSSYGSAIYDSAGTGVHAMKGCLYYYYVHSYGGTSSTGMGFPTSDELSMGGGHAQHFAKGTGLYDGPGTGIHVVLGAIEGHYISLGEANSFLGFPITDETGVSTGRVSYFGGTSWGSHCGNPGPYNSYGAIYWSGPSGVAEVHGCLYDAYVNRFGGPDGRLGFPNGDQINPAGGGHIQYFQNGFLQSDVNGNITMHITCPPAC